MMDPEIQRQFEVFDEILKIAETQVLIVDGMKELCESQKKTNEQISELARTMRELAEAQKGTEESLRRLIDRTGNGHVS